MQLRVLRDTFTDKSTIGELYVDDIFQCYTLEPRSDRSQGKPYCIPAGTYPLELVFSPRFEMVTPHVMAVEGFTEIEIHPGNDPSDTEGCTLVGQTRNVDFVGSSRLAFGALMEKLTGQADLQITYVGGQ